jgi:hypothetical protein
LPTVVNVPGFVARLEREGGTAPVVVDGTAGTVTIETDTVDDPTDDLLPSRSVSTEPDPNRDAPNLDRAQVPTGSVHAAAYAPARVSDRRWDDTNVPLGVFVAGLMGAGAVMSAIVGLSDSFSSRQGRERLSRRPAPVARRMADGAVDGFDAVASSAVGLRPRRDYAVVAVFLLVFGGAITARSSDLYFGDEVAALGWALTLTGGITLLAAGFFAGSAALAWPRVPMVVRRLAPGRGASRSSIWNAVPRRARIAIAVMATVVAIGAVFVTFALSWVLKIDRPIYFDWLHAGGSQNRWGPDWFNEFGRVPLLIVVPIIVFAITFLRCRVVAIAYPLVIAVGGSIFLTLNWTVHRLRPPFSAHAGQHTSYPGGHSIQVALVLLTLPLVVWVLTSNTALRVIGTIIPVGLWATTEIDTIRTGGHWPIDQGAGLLIAASLLTIVYSVGLNAIQHESCHGGPVARNVMEEPSLPAPSGPAARCTRRRSRRSPEQGVRR